KPWDEKRSGFQIGEPSQSPPSLFGTPLLFKLPDFWPVPMPVARAFAESRRSQLVAPVYLAVRVIITGTTRPSRSILPQDPLDPPLYFRTGLRAGANWEFEFEEMTLYGDAALTQKLHEFGRPLQPPKPIIGTPAAQTPHPAGPVLFDTETVILAASRPPA